MQPLENVLNEINQEEQELVFQSFIVTDLETAAEAQRRIAYFNDQMAQIDAITEKQIEPFKAKIEKIQEWGKQAKQEFEEKQSFYANQLEFFMREEVKKQVEAGKKPKKTVKLPYGSIALKKQQPEFEKDEEALLEYAKENGFVKVKESADWATIKKLAITYGEVLIDENGVEIPGVRVIERDERFELKMD